MNKKVFYGSSLLVFSSRDLPCMQELKNFPLAEDFQNTSVRKMSFKFMDFL